MPGTVTSVRSTSEQNTPHSITTQQDWRETQTLWPNAPEVGPQPPYRYLGGSLGFCDDFPIVRFTAPGGGRFEGDAAVILRHIDLFAEPDRSRILFDTAMQYGLDPCQMVDRNHQPAQDAPRTGEQS